jgi:dTDP-4-dehydrorhamnose reductase
MSRVVVLGASGLLGNTLCPTLAAAGHEVFPQGRGADAVHRADPSDAAALRALFERVRADIVINLVGDTNVDHCEDEPGAAFAANAGVVDAVTRAMRGRPAHLVHVSTDQLYEGAGPHAEEPVQPINVYGITKYAGELLAASAGATILRTNFFGRSNKPGRTSISDWVVNNLRSGTRITVFEDVLFSPLHLTTLCSLIGDTMQSRTAGVFNLGSRQGLSKAQFARQLAQRLALDTSLLTPGHLKDVKLRARRPLDMRTVSSRFESTFKKTLPALDAEINRAAEEYRS